MGITIGSTEIYDEAQIITTDKSSRLPRFRGPRLRRPRIKSIAIPLVCFAGGWAASENYNNTPGTSCSDGTTTISATKDNDGSTTVAVAGNPKTPLQFNLGDKVVRIGNGDTLNLLSDNVPTNLQLPSGPGPVCTLSI